MTMKKVEVAFITIIAILIGCLLGINIIMTTKSVEIKKLENKIETLENEVVESYDKGYSDGEEHAFNDLMEDYYTILIENAVLKERLEHQPSNQEMYEQIIDDFELVIELQQHYYQENITSHSFGDWLQINYPALYQRLLNYF